MSDYLGHLVSRLILPTAGVQPRLPSLFEPHAKAEPDVEPDLTAASAPERSHRLAGTQTRSDTRVEARAETAPGTQTQMLARSDGLAAVDREGDSRPLPPFERAPAPTDGPSEGALTPVTLPRDLIGPAVALGDGAPIPAPRRTVNPAVDGSASAAEPPSSPGVPPARRHGASVSDLPFARLAQPRSGLEPPAARPRVVPAHVGSPRARPATAPAASARDGGGTENAIHVTIGRVEIRAASTPTASRASASASASPAMTLGEYLRQRRAPGER